MILLIQIFFVVLIFICVKNVIKSHKKRKCLKSSKKIQKFCENLKSNEKNIEIDENISFKRTHCDSKSDSKSLVLLFGWLNATERHLKKYQDIYLEKGFNVLTIRTQPLDILLPSLGSQIIAQNVLHVLEELHHDTFLIHLFSVGSYQLGEVLVRLEHVDNHVVRDSYLKGLKGLIMDSAVDVKTADKGIAKTLTNNQLLRHLVTLLMKLYMMLLYPWVTCHYQRSSDSVRAHPTGCPVLFLFSRDDGITDPENNSIWIREFLSRGVNVRFKCWEDSKHCCHLLKYHGEYLEVLNSFLNELKF